MSLLVSQGKSYLEVMLEEVKKAFSIYETFEMKVPTDVLKRADLMCMYVQEENEYTFNIDNLITLLYKDFIKYSVKNYNPSRVLREVTRRQRNFDDIDNDTIVLSMNGKEHKVNRVPKTKYSTLEIKMPKDEYRKGQLILDELEALYGYKIPFGVMYSNLLINFIEDYKEGINKRAYTSLVKVLKQTMND